MTGFSFTGAAYDAWPAWPAGDTPRLMDDGSSPSTTWRFDFDAFAQDPGYIAYQEELRDLIFHTATNAAPSPEAAAATPTSPESTGTNTAGGVLLALADDDTTAEVRPPALSNTGEPASPLQQARALQRLTAAVLSRGRRFAYLQNYVGQVAPWLDMFDNGSRIFGVEVPVLARDSPALLYAILALSARQIERRGAGAGSRGGATSAINTAAAEEGSHRGTSVTEAVNGSVRHCSYADSLELYQEAIRLLRPLLQAHDPLSVPICTVLCVMEMMSASAQDWRKHLEGCAALFDAFRVHGFGGGLFQAVFWCYARMDLCGALMSDGTQSTLVPPAKWLAPGTDETAARNLFREANSPDAHANYAVYLCAKVCELIADRTRFSELAEANGCDGEAFARRWQRLWDDLQGWVDDRCLEMLPVQTVETQPFPQILFTHWAAISSNQLYHTACILLLQSMPAEGARAVPAEAASATGHARRVCGISLTNPHQGCLNNAIQPLWIAGRLLSHRSEHTFVVKLIREIESMTGWAACWRIPDLEVVWGYKVGR